MMQSSLSLSLSHYAVPHIYHRAPTSSPSSSSETAQILLKIDEMRSREFSKTSAVLLSHIPEAAKCSVRYTSHLA